MNRIQCLSSGVRLMCYSGICMFELHNGDCMIHNFKEITEKFGIGPCQMPTCKEEEEFIKMHKETYKQIKVFLDRKRYMSI